MHHRILIPAVLLLALFGAALRPAQAAAVQAVGLSFIGCDTDNVPRFEIGVTGSFVQENAPGVDRVYVALFDGYGRQVTYASPFDFAPGETGQTRLYAIGAGGQIPWLQLPAANPLRAVVFEPNGAYITEGSAFSFCTFPTLTDTDPRVTLGSGAAFLFTSIDLREGRPAWGPQGLDLLVYAPYPDVSRGFEVIRVSARRLREPLPTRNTLLARSRQPSRDGMVEIYRLTTGEIQINVGPNQDGLVQVFILDGVPPRRIYGEDFILNR